MATITQNRSGRMFKNSVNLPEEKRAEIIEILNARLADTLDLKTQTKQAHWNVKGKDFFQLHALFDQLAAETLEHVDEIAERATALGGYATGTVRMSAENSTLTEYPTDCVEGLEHVRALVER